MNGILLVSLLGLLTTTMVLAQTAPATAASGASAGAPAPSLSQSTSILGKLFGVNFTTSANSAQNGMTLSLGATLLGSQKSLVQASVQPNATFTDGNLQVYVNGAQISSVSGAIEQANWADKVTFPPVNVNGKIVSVPVGPLTIEVDGGFSLTGNLNTDVALNVSEGQTGTPSGVEATLGTTIQSAAFLSGSVSLIVIRGGLEGQLDVADGTVQTKADLYFGKTPPTFTATGQLGILAGSVSAFADYWGLFSGWQQFWSATLFKWGGFCFNFNNGVKFVDGACAAH